MWPRPYYWNLRKGINRKHASIWAASQSFYPEFFQKLGAKQPICMATGGKDGTKEGAYGPIICDPGLSGLYVVMKLCVYPCIADSTSTCCLVPKSIGHLFPCCRSKGCCPDQQHRRALQAVGERSRTLQSGAGLSATVTITIEESSSTRSTFDTRLTCLRSNSPASCSAVAGNGGH